MEIKILVTASYADFESRPGYVLAKQLQAGTIANFPAEYAQSLIDAGLAEPPNARAVEQLMPEEPAPPPEKQPKRGRR